MSSTYSNADGEVQTTLYSRSHSPINDLRTSRSNHSTSCKVFRKGETNHLQPLLDILASVNTELHLQHLEVIFSRSLGRPGANVIKTME